MHVGLCGWTSEELLEDAHLKDAINDSYAKLKHEKGPGLATILERARVQEHPYDAVVLLAGTNDLGQGRHCSDVIDDIRKLHALCRQCGVMQTLALTVPHSYFETKYTAKHGRPDPKRAAVNSALRQLGSQEPTVCLVDLESDAHRSRLELDFPKCDGLHLTELGYDSLGDIVADHLCNIFPDVCISDLTVEPSSRSDSTQASVRTEARSRSPQDRRSRWCHGDDGWHLSS